MNVTIANNIAVLADDVRAHTSVDLAWRVEIWESHVEFARISVRSEVLPIIEVA